MAKPSIILISNIAIPSNRIGSWVTRIDSLLQNHDCFDWILSPHPDGPKHISCKKRSFITHNGMVRKAMLTKWVAKDYVQAVKRLAKNGKPLRLLVMDDPHLVEAMGIIKQQLPTEVELIFSFHGYRLKLKQEVLVSIDRVLFLSQAGLDESRNVHKEFTPTAEVVWNGVDSERFFPLNDSDRSELRKELGIGPDQVVLTWMANDRPLKGFAIFKEMAESLLKAHDNLKIFTIGTNQAIDHDAVHQMGRLEHHLIARYLQATDFYFFTTLYEEGFGLSMIEALKCGGVVLASSRGAIPSVLEGRSRAILVADPEDPAKWIEAANGAIAREWDSMASETAKAIWNYEDWEQRFMAAIGYDDNSPAT